MTGTLIRILHRLQDLLRSVLAALETMILFPTPFRHRTRHTRSKDGKPFPAARWPRHSLDELAQEIDRLFNMPLTIQNMLAMSVKTREQLQNNAKSSAVSMLPSYTYALPTGKETGKYLAIDVGGSTVRVALVELNGREKGMQVLKASSSIIDEQIKLLEGTAFFDWMAEKIETMLTQVGDGYGRDPENPLPVGLSWSFPIDQTANGSGLMIHMGKGFKCSEGLVGEELGGLIVCACQKRKLNVQVDAIVNDGSATLLSRAYFDPKTRMSLILGTGTNCAVHYPVYGIGLPKFGVRPTAWFDKAKNVIVNSELSMFGGGILPMSRWDEILNRTHLRPDYQPLEYMITGRYLGEIVRLIVVEAVETAGLFGGELPHSLRDPYSLDTALLAFLESDTSSTLSASAALFQKHYTFRKTPSTQEWEFIRQVTRNVSRRAAGYLAVAIHSMWCLRNDVEFSGSESTLSMASTKRDEPLLNRGVAVTEVEEPSRSLTIACDGSVINKYPGFREQCQTYLDMLTKNTNASSETLIAEKPHIKLELAPESAILGAAVAVAVAMQG